MDLDHGLHPSLHSSLDCLPKNRLFSYQTQVIIKMKFFTLSVLSLLGAGMVSAHPRESFSVKRGDSTEDKVNTAAAALAGKQLETESETSDCVGPLLCCGSLTTPLDPIVDPLLLALGVDAASIVGSVGLLCTSTTYLVSHSQLLLTYLPGHGYDSSCDSKPQCCTEANLLVGGNLKDYLVCCLTNLFVGRYCRSWLRGPEVRPAQQDF